jgi:HD-GYP domain
MKKNAQSAISKPKSKISKPQSLRVLMVEDSEDDVLLIIRELKKGGYNPVYERVETATAMEKAFRENQWDIILCDYKLPKFNATSAIAVLKETNIDIPFLLVSGSIGEETAVECMRLGAQDYIMKDNLSRLCPAIAVEMNLKSEQIDGVRMASMIHDIGKISIPSEILTKPTQLTNLEFNLIKTHPVSGYNILKDIELPWPIARIVLEHHERIDGSGYPNGLKGEQILLESRIIAIADVVETISSHRPYRAAHGIDAGLDEITKNSGILYDPDLVDACLRLFREKNYNLAA